MRFLRNRRNHGQGNVRQLLRGLPPPGAGPIIKICGGPYLVVFQDEKHEFRRIGPAMPGPVANNPIPFADMRNRDGVVTEAADDGVAVKLMALLLRGPAPFD
jgi:hypothetical protein